MASSSLLLMRLSLTVAVRIIGVLGSAVCALSAGQAAADVRPGGYEPTSCSPHGALVDTACMGAFSQCKCTYIPDGGSTLLDCPGAVQSPIPPSGTYFYHRVTTCSAGLGPTWDPPENPPKFAPELDKLSCGHMRASSHSAPGSPHILEPFVINGHKEFVGHNDWTHDCSLVSDAGDDQVVCQNALVTLDGSASTDPKGDPLIFAWSQVDGPLVTLAGANTSMPTFQANLPIGSKVSFLLTVKDFYPLVPGGPGNDVVTVTVGLPPGHSPPSASGPPICIPVR